MSSRGSGLPSPIAEAAAETVRGDRPRLAVFPDPLPTAVLEAPEATCRPQAPAQPVDGRGRGRHRRRRGPRLRRRHDRECRPRRRGSTGHRSGRSAGARSARTGGPRRRGRSRSVVRQPPLLGVIVTHRDGRRLGRSSTSTLKLVRQPRHGSRRERRREGAGEQPRHSAAPDSRSVQAEESSGGAGGPRTRTVRRRRGQEAGADGIVVSSGRRAPFRTFAASGSTMQSRSWTAASTRTSSRRSGTVPQGTRQSPAPDARAVLGSNVTLTIARAPEWKTTVPQSGSVAPTLRRTSRSRHRRANWRRRP